MTVSTGISSRRVSLRRIPGRLLNGTTLASIGRCRSPVRRNEKVRSGAAMTRTSTAIWFVTPTRRDSTASTVDKSFLSITCDFLWMTAPDTAKTEPALITCLTNSRITGRHAIGSLSRLQCVGEPFLFLVSRPVCTLDEFVGLINESGSLPL